MYDACVHATVFNGSDHMFALAFAIDKTSDAQTTHNTPHRVTQSHTLTHYKRARMVTVHFLIYQYQYAI